MPYNCNLCNKYFLSNSGFWKHKKNIIKSKIIKRNISPPQSTHFFLSPPQNTHIFIERAINNISNLNKYKIIMI